MTQGMPGNLWLGKAVLKLSGDLHKYFTVMEDFWIAGRPDSRKEGGMSVVGLVSVIF